MSPQSQRIAIAEACGYKPHTPGALGVPRWIAAEYETGDPGNGVVYLDELPDYLNDLNAMHVVEYKLLFGKLYELYCNQIAKLSPPCDSNTAQFAVFAVCNSTAAQRAEAFLRTIGKWEEGA